MKYDHSGIIQLLRMVSANPEDASIQLTQSNDSSLCPPSSLKENDQSVWEYMTTLTFSVYPLELSAIINIHFSRVIPKHSGDLESYVTATRVGGYVINDLAYIGNSVVVNPASGFYFESDEMNYGEASDIMHIIQEIIVKHKKLQNPSQSFKASLLVKSKMKKHYP